MSFATKEDADVERLVNTLTMDERSLSTTNLNALSSTDLQHLADLSDNLAMTTEADEQTVIVEEPMQMEVEGEEEIQEEIPEELHEEVIEGEDEMELETDVIHAEEIIETKPKAVPPLRPLSIAPKPIQVKPVTTSGGQQLLFVQNAGEGQQIKLISASGQNINLSNLNFSGGKIAIKNAMPKTKTITGKKLLTQLPKGLTKASFDGKQQIMLVQKNDQIKLLQTSNATTIIPKTKTLTIAQAQQMGILMTKGTKQIIMNKSTGKTVKLIPQMKSRAPTKILPAPTGGKVAQRIYIKTNQSNTTVLPNQMLQIAGGQMVAPGQIHQVVTGKGGVQYIKFVTQPETTETTTNTYAVKSGNKLIPISVAPGSSVKSGNIILSEVKSATSTSTQPTLITTKPITSSSLTSSSHSSLLSSTATGTQAKLIPISRNTQIIHSRSGSIGNTIATTTSATHQIVVLPPGYTTANAGAVHGVTTLNTTTGVAKALQHVRVSGGGVQTNIVPTSRVVVPVTQMSASAASGGATSTGSDSSASAAIEEILKMENNGMRPRKPCNCTKSQCLKLYCDCFANGEFCYMCNCMNCNNNIAHEEFRQRAIRSCLERNPNAFRPKIGKSKDGSMMAPVGIGVHTDIVVPLRKHTKGCNCKRSGCLKNYCECYEAKIGCSSNCKCIGCRNMETDKSRSARSSISYSGDTSPVSQSQDFKGNDGPKELSLRPKRVSQTKQPFNFITNEVIEATSQCLLAISDNAESLGQPEEATKVHIIQEFGRCLKQIIDCAQTTKSIRGN